jgi:hypothetical protein
MNDFHREFPLPKVIGNGTGGFGEEPIGSAALRAAASVSPYAPPMARQSASEAIDNLPDFIAARLASRVDNIKEWLKLLTHREMRDLVREIFDAHAQLFPQNESNVLAKSIKASELADVLDKVAHGAV